MIGYKELMILLPVMAVVLFVGVGVAWFLIRALGKSVRATTGRTLAERLAELESLKQAEQITAAEYEKQRAAIVSSI